MTAKKAAEAAQKLLNEMNTIFLATNGEEGFPDVRAISVVKSDGLKTVWMLTGDAEVTGEHKTKELEKDPRCMIYATEFEDDEEYVELRLRGTMEVLSDAESRRTAWNDVYRCYFPGGVDDPSLRVLKFTASSAFIRTIEGGTAFDF